MSLPDNKKKKKKLHIQFYIMKIKGATFFLSFTHPDIWTSDKQKRKTRHWTMILPTVDFKGMLAALVKQRIYCTLNYANVQFVYRG